MPEPSSVAQTSFEIVLPDGTCQLMHVTQHPFYIGRGDSGNQLQLADRRISRQCAVVLLDGGSYRLQDRGQRTGLFINGERISNWILRDGDVVTFGLENSCHLVFHSTAPTAATASIESLLTRIGNASTEAEDPGGLGKLNLLLEATRLLHSQLPLEAILDTMLDHAVSITNADRGLLLEPEPGGSFRVRGGRRKGNVALGGTSVAPSQTALRLALAQRSSVITEDVAQADQSLQDAQSIVAQRLRSVVVIPLYGRGGAASGPPETAAQPGDVLGVVYLDSQRPAAFSALDRQVLDAIAMQAAGILDNARLVALERQREYLEQELSIARKIQQALLPRAILAPAYLTVDGFSSTCLEVGGDYYDVFPLDQEHTAFLVADVSGKGLGAALVATMLQGALSGISVAGSPAQVFDHLNRVLCEHEDVGRYISLFFGVLDRGGRLEFIRAGHPSPVLIRRGESTEPFAQGCFPVGLIPEARFSASVMQLEPGDTLALFSDGVTEAEDASLAQFQSAGLLAAISREPDAPLGKLRKNILDAVETFTGGASQADDITLLLLRYHGSSASAVQESSTNRQTAWT